VNNFLDYATYYDLLYHDKDYSSEAEYIHKIISKYSKEYKKILSLGCGTGRYESELAKFGYDITGIDNSCQMIDIAKSNYPNRKDKFFINDIREFDLDCKYDIVLSLFHVMNYQITNEDILATLNCVKRHLKNGGIFIFDFWYGPAVLNDPPSVRVKRVNSGNGELVRIAEPTMHYESNVVEVNFEVFIQDEYKKSISNFKEKHLMRYFFLPEIRSWIENSGLRFKEARKWMSGQDLEGNDSWYGLVVSQNNA
jgi:SAM-dependent methyltransferase